MPLRSLKNRAGEPESTIVSGKEIDFRTSRSAGTPNVDCNLRIWYHMRGPHIGQWWTYWKEKGSTTLNGPLTMNDSVDGNVTSVDGNVHFVKIRQRSEDERFDFASTHALAGTSSRRQRLRRRQLATKQRP